MWVKIEGYNTPAVSVQIKDDNLGFNKVGVKNRI
jgi:hypothetical protein